MTSGKKKILVVDDENMVRFLASIWLQMKNYDTIEANSGAEALEILEHEEPYAVLTDFSMPGMTGYELGKRLRSKEPPYRGRVFLMSGNFQYARDKNPEKYRDFEKIFDGYLEKPFDMNEFFDFIKNQVDEKYQTGK